MSKMGLHDPFEFLKHKLWPKKGRESNCQFDSRPLKVRNFPNFLTCKWHATYLSKDLDKGYNFFLNLISIRGLKKKLLTPKVEEVPISKILGILGLQLGSPGTK
jgi:hypothetical protein